MCLPQVIKSFQNYRGVATTFYPTLVYAHIHQWYNPRVFVLWLTHVGMLVKSKFLRIWRFHFLLTIW